MREATLVVLASLLVVAAAAPSKAAAQRVAPTPQASGDVVYVEFQVEKPAAAVPGNPAPPYPAPLRLEQVEGSVLVQFVVDTAGLADTSTFRMLKTTHDLFTSAVRATLPAMRFTPAQIGDRKVKQLVQMPFYFTITKQ